MTAPGKPSSLVANLPELCHSLMECSPVPMAELEGIGHIVRYVNPAFCRLVGKDRETLTGTPFSETVQKGDGCLAVLDRVFHSGDAEIHTESEQVDPHPAYWTYAIWPVLDADRCPMGLMMQVTETTLFHQQTGEMNQELLRSSVRQHERTETAEKLNYDLERRVFERTQELMQSEDRLRALATELNLAEQRERQRVATELHDYLAQLLVLCRMTLGQAKRTGLPPRGEDLVRETEETLGKALTYCRTLMAELSPPVLQEHGLPAGLVWLAEHMKRQELTVTVEIQAFDVPLPEDRAVLLFQSVRELLINVAKHGAVKEATVRMCYEDRSLKIVVRDENGFDLAAAAAAAAAAVNTSPHSSKFGLFSIRERMKALGGAFEIVSAPGTGTTATLMLPLGNMKSPNVECSTLNVQLEQRFPEPSDNSTLKITHSTFQQHTNRIRVLLVDDHTVMRQGLRSIVTAYPHLEVVGEAGDGEEAVELAQQLDPDVVVMDINMPNMDGIEATRRIKANRPSTVVIGLSVNQSVDTEQKMKAAGAAAYLTKESAVDVLCQAIDKAVSYQQGADDRRAC